MTGTLPLIEPFDATFEDLSIHVDRMTATIFDVKSEPEVQYTALTDIQHTLVKHFYKNGRDLVGGIILFFRNQGNHFDTMLLVEGDIMAHSEVDEDGASVFCKMVQYLFDRINKYVAENRIKDLKGENFTMPAFHYSKQDFPSFRG
jgi:hypothetical protein